MKKTITLLTFFYLSTLITGCLSGGSFARILNNQKDESIPYTDEPVFDENDIDEITGDNYQEQVNGNQEHENVGSTSGDGEPPSENQCIPDFIDQSEICDGVDNNCDGIIDEDVCNAVYYCDSDYDGYYGYLSAGECDSYNCVPSNCVVEQGDDCDDSNDKIHSIGNCTQESNSYTITAECPHSVSYTQGTEKVDILWVVDNSPSMNEEQEILGRDFSNFINRIRSVATDNLDYHLGVVTTQEFSEPKTMREKAQYSSLCDDGASFDNRCEGWENEGLGKLQHSYWMNSEYSLHSNKYIAYSSLNTNANSNMSGFAITPLCEQNGISSHTNCAMLEFAIVGTGGHFAESGMVSAEFALTDRSGYNDGFIRSDVPLNVIFLSDSDDMSDFDKDERENNESSIQRALDEYKVEFGDNWKSNRTIDYYKNFFGSYKSDKNLVDIYAIIFTKTSRGSDICSFDKGPAPTVDGVEVKYAYRYEKLIEGYYGGKREHIIDICDANLDDQIVNKIGESIGKKLSLFYLDEIDKLDENTITVGVVNAQGTSKSIDNCWQYDADNSAIDFKDGCEPEYGDIIGISFDDVHSYKLQDRWVSDIQKLEIQFSKNGYEEIPSCNNTSQNCYQLDIDKETGDSTVKIYHDDLLNHTDGFQLSIEYRYFVE